MQLRVEQQGREAVFTVTDHGIGIPLADRQRLFESFQRGGNVGQISGTGLGLVVVKRGVEHRTAADKEAEIIIFEPAGVRNTGDVVDQTYTAPEGVRI